MAIVLHIGKVESRRIELFKVSDSGLKSLNRLLKLQYGVLRIKEVSLNLNNRLVHLSLRLEVLYSAGNRHRGLDAFICCRDFCKHGVVYQ